MTMDGDGQGAAVLVVCVVSLAWTARTVRARWLVGWSGAPARLAEAVLALSALVVVSELLGTFGAYRAGWVTIGCVGLGAVTLVSARLGQPARRPARRQRSLSDEGLFEQALAVASVAAVAAAWAQRSAAALSEGVTDLDSLSTRLAVAAHITRSGSTRSLLGSGLVTHDARPQNATLVHTLGMLALHRDALSSAVNLGWLALALLSAWCIGRPDGRGHLAVAGAAAALSTPMLLASGPGQATDDIAALALLLATVALLRSGRGRVADVAVAGAAAGLAVGTSMVLAVPVLVLGVAAVVTAPVVRRRRAVAWAAGAVVTGGYWYVVNGVVGQVPAPAWSAALLATTSTAAASTAVTSTGLSSAGLSSAGLTSTAGPRSPWSNVALDARSAWGPAWALLVVVAVLGVVLAVRRREDNVGRTAAAAACAGALATAGVLSVVSGATPAPGRSPLADALVHMVPLLGVALALIGCSPALGNWMRRVLVAVLAAATASGIIVDLRGLPGSAGRTWGIIAGPAVGAVWALWLSRRHLRRWFGTGASFDASGWRRLLPTAVVAGTVALTWAVAARLTTAATADRYRVGSSDPTSELYRWAQGVSGARIGVVGLRALYPLAGQDLSNDVRQVGPPSPDRSAPPAADLEAFVANLRAAHFDLVVVDPSGPTTAATVALEEAWLGADPAAHLLANFNGVEVWRLDPAPGALPRRLVLPPVTPTPPPSSLAISQPGSHQAPPAPPAPPATVSPLTVPPTTPATRPPLPATTTAVPRGTPAPISPAPTTTTTVAPQTTSVPSPTTTVAPTTTTSVPSPTSTVAPTTTTLVPSPTTAAPVRAAALVAAPSSPPEMVTDPAALSAPPGP